MDRGTRRGYNLGLPRVRHDLTTKHLHHRQRNEGVKESQIMPNRRQGKENRNSWHGQERMRKSPHSAFRLSLRSPGWRCASQWLGLNMCGSVLSDSLWPHGHPWNSASQNTGVGSLSLLQGIFPTQGSNPGLLHCRRILHQLSLRGSPEQVNHCLWPALHRCAHILSVIPTLRWRTPATATGSNCENR